VSEKRLTRRELLTVGALAAAGGALTLYGAGKTTSGATGSDLLDSAGKPFLDPPELPLVAMKDGAREARLTVRNAEVRLSGDTAIELVTYNGSFPGPLIRVRSGDRLRLVVQNDLPRGDENLLGVARGTTNLHTHGWHVSPSDPADNVMRQIPPGESWPYSYDLSSQRAGTLGWYHPHVHGLVAEQLWGGLAGPLVVEDATQVLRDFETHALVLKDFAFADGKPAPYSSPMDFMMGKIGALVTVNGLVEPVLTAQPGQVQRWRVLNASTSRFYRLALQGHALHVVGTDGGLLDKPYQVDKLLLAPGERLDLLIKASDTPGSYRLLTLPYARGSMMGSMMGGMMGGGTTPQATLMTLRVSGRIVTERLPSTVDPTAQSTRSNVSAAVQRRFELGMAGGRGFINGFDFDVEPLVVRSRLPKSGSTWEVWTIVNTTGMDHPWHQHVNPAQMLSISGGDAGYAALYTQAPAWKDTVIVPRDGSVTQLVRVSDWPGQSMFHCHIVEHEDVGMLGVWEIA
jgi:FtsP/CotA-like multicopper oxidase with cupredoxin domain